jgi:hypothetical protein
MWISMILLQDLADLHQSVENTGRQARYAFSYERAVGAGPKKKKDSAPAAAVTGVAAPGILYLKFGGLEVARGSEATMARADGGDWKPVQQILAELKKRDPAEAPAQGPDVTLEELLKFPAPHTLVAGIYAQLKKPAKKEGAFEGELAESYARELVKKEWFAQGDDRDWSTLHGRLKISLAEENLIAGLQFDIEGDLVPENRGDAPRPSRPGRPNRPPRNPARAADRWNLPEGQAILRIAFEEYGTAKLPIPDDLAKRLGAKK